MARKHQGLPRAVTRVMKRTILLRQLQTIDSDAARRGRVLRLETNFRVRIGQHIASLPSKDGNFSAFNTNPYVLLIHAKQMKYTKISQIESGILPAKQFSSMETSAGRMIEEVVLPEYGWECVASEMQTSNSALDGKSVHGDVYRLATLKSGPRCLNDEMSENFADNILANFKSWARESGRHSIDFTYGVLYGTEKMSNKKDWHILRNVQSKRPDAMTILPANRWNCRLAVDDVTVNVTIRIGMDWWTYLGGELCFAEVFTALIRACVNAGTGDPPKHAYVIRDLGDVVSMSCVSESYNVSLLQRSQIPWFFLMARHFCDSLID